MKRIAIFIPSLDGGGAERSMVNVANGLARLGIAVDLLVIRASGPYFSDLSATVNVISFNKKRILFSLLPLIRYLHRSKPDSLLSCLNYVNIISIIANIFNFFGTRLIISERSIISRNLAEKNDVISRISVFLMRHLYKLSSGVIAISEDVAKDVMAFAHVPAKNIFVIYNPIDIDDIIRKSRLPNSHPWLKEDHIPIIIGVGRLVESKGFIDLINAFNLIRGKRVARLVILGDGPMHSRLMSLVSNLGIEDDVLFPGFVENPFSWMRRSSVFVLSSHHEGFGNVLVEAMAAGVNVVSTNCPGGPKSILANGRWGKLVPVGSSLELALAIINVLDNPPDIELHARASDFSIENISRKYMRVLVNDE